MTIQSIIEEIRDGRLAVEIKDELNKLVTACEDTRKKGKLVITLTIKPHAESMLVQGCVSAALPEPERADTTFFANEEGELQRNNPAQKDLPFNTVSMKSATAINQ